MGANDMHRPATILILGFLLLSTGRVGAGIPLPPGAVPMPGTELLQMTSTHTGRDYDLYISNPGGRKDGTLYPVVYVLDGQWFFKTVDSIWAAMHYDRFLPAAIIVGITYSGQAPGYCELRMLDMTPTPGPGRPTGPERRRNSSPLSSTRFCSWSSHATRWIQRVGP